MKLYFKAKCESGMAYVVDWLAVTFTHNNENVELVMDVQGEQDIYGSINTRSKDLVAWVIRDEDGDEREVEEDFSDEELFEIIRTGECHRVGLYPFAADAESIKKAAMDEFTNCLATVFYENEDFEFKCDAEANV